MLRLKSKMPDVGYILSFNSCTPYGVKYDASVQSSTRESVDRMVLLLKMNHHFEVLLIRQFETVTQYLSDLPVVRRNRTELFFTLVSAQHCAMLNKENQSQGRPDLCPTQRVACKIQD